MAIPILWRVLPKAGCTSFVERKEIIEEFINLFGVESIKYLTADREFHGQRFYQYLGERRIRFCLRARFDTPLSDATGEAVKLRRILHHQRLGVKVYWSGRRRVWGQEVKVVSARLGGAEWLVIVGSAEVGDLFAAYAVRWEIETLFGCLKTRGFCLEATHLSEPARLASLVGVLALCFCWALRAGIWSSEQRALPLKTHRRLAKSLFRTGFDCLRQVVTGLHVGSHLLSWRQAVQFLSCTEGYAFPFGEKRCCGYAARARHSLAEVGKVLAVRHSLTAHQAAQPQMSSLRKASKQVGNLIRQSLDTPRSKETGILKLRTS